MGLSTNTIISILKLLQKDAANMSLCMMGKQSTDAVDWPSLLKIVTQCGFYYNVDELERHKEKSQIDSFDLFKIFGFSEVHAVDVSPYEGADIILDLNKDLPSDLYQKFDFVLDGGTLEHMFDSAKAIKNMANMVKDGGYIIHINPVAGYVNHGFHSFSPCMYSAFYQANAFEIKEFYLRFSKYDKQTKSYADFASSLDCRMIPDINKYIFDMQRTAGDAYMQTLLWCSAKKKGRTVVDTYPIQVFAGRALGSNWEQNIIRFFHENHDKEIALYGKGECCDRLLDELFKNDLDDRVKCIFDSSPRKAGTMFRGYKVFYPTKAKLKAVDIIIISNTKNADDIYSILSGFGTEITDKVYRLSQI